MGNTLVAQSYALYDQGQGNAGLLYSNHRASILLGDAG
jgi:hypothetical protein